MSSHHQHHAPQAGRVDGPGLLYGGVGLVLAMTMHMVGLFKIGDAQLLKFLLQPVFHGITPDALTTPALVLLSAVFCFGLAFAVLDSAGTWRRVVLGVTMMILVFAMVPTFAVWNVYFSPFLPAIGVFWSWFCTMMYVNHHVMPCDLINSKYQVSNTKVVAATQPTVQEAVPEVKVEPKKQEAKKLAKKKKDPDEKYKPKDAKEKKK